jgi:hypothetical protein
VAPTAAGAPFADGIALISSGVAAALAAPGSSTQPARIAVVDIAIERHPIFLFIDKLH